MGHRLFRAWDRYLLTEDARGADCWELEQLAGLWFPREPCPDVYRRFRAALATLQPSEPIAPPETAPEIDAPQTGA